MNKVGGLVLSAKLYYLRHYGTGTGMYKEKNGIENLGTEHYVHKKLFHYQVVSADQMGKDRHLSK